MARVSLENLPKEIRDHLGDSGIFALQNVLTGAFSGIETELQKHMTSTEGKLLLTSVYKKLVRCNAEIGEYMQLAVRDKEQVKVDAKGTKYPIPKDDGPQDSNPESSSEDDLDRPVSPIAGGSNAGFGQATQL